jgi:hypothetical protein
MRISTSFFGRDGFWTQDSAVSGSRPVFTAPNVPGATARQLTGHSAAQVTTILVSGSLLYVATNGGEVYRLPKL